MPEAPSSSFLDLIALRLLNSDGRQIGMATLISRSVALTIEQNVDDHQTYFLSRFTLSGEGPRISASVIARDAKVGFAALGLDSPIHEQLPHVDAFLSHGLATPETGWNSLYYSSNQWHRVSGKVVSTGLMNGNPRILLSRADAIDHSFASHALGAPVIVGQDWLVGIGVYESGWVDYAAIPVREMLESPEWRRIAEALQYEYSLSRADGANDAAPQSEDFAEYASEAPPRVIKVSKRPTAKRRPSAPKFDREAFQARLTSSSLTAFTHANGILRAQGQGKMHMEHLLAGLFQKNNGPTRNEFMRAGINRDRLAQIIAEQVGTSLPPENGYPLQEGPALSVLSKHVEEAFQAALAEADKNKSEAIRTRHLIRGALAVRHCTLIKALLKEGVTPERIPLQDPEIPPIPRRPTQAGIKSDDPEGEDLLDIKNEVEALCTVLAAKEVTPPISLGLFGDWGSGKSFFMKKMEVRFNELRDVARKGDSSFCANIVQLWFNAWHYMDTNLWASLATEIFDKLAQELARQDALIMGIEDPDYARAQLVSQQANATEAVAQAEQEKREADAKVRASEQQLARVQSGDTAVSMSPQDVLRAGYRFAVQQPEVRQQVANAEQVLNQKVEEAAKALKIDQPVESVKEELLELQGIFGYLRAIVLAVVNNKNKARWFLSLGLILVIGALLYWVPQWIAPAWVQSSWLWVTRWLLLVVTAIAPFLPIVHRAVKIIHAAIEANRESIERVRLEAEKRLQLEHAKLRQSATEAEQKLEQASLTAKKLTKDLEDLRSDRQITNFIRQRQQSSDYTKYLGVIAKARNDFEQLSTLLVKEQERSAKERDEQRKRKLQAALADVQQATQATDQGPLLPRIDRIILYIDDLDRCPEHKVVDVLQAVHLLLAFPLFVVVVGVDPRWLLHSLRQHSQAFRDQIEENHDSNEEQKQWQSTPLNYLEKIFQIPFTLWPMGKSGFGKMVDTLTEPPKPPKKEEESEQTIVEPKVSDKAETKPKAEQSEGLLIEQDVSTDKVTSVPVEAVNWWKRFVAYVKRSLGLGQVPEAKQAADESTTTETSAAQAPPAKPEEPAKELGSSEERQPGGGQVTSELPTAAIDPNPEHLQIESWERAFMKELHQLIPSPRATKRFINIYRLIRAAVDLDEKLALEEFIGNEKQGKYRAALLLLAILTGYPDQATEILRELVENKHTETWWQFVDSFKGRAEIVQVTQAGKDAANGKRTIKSSALAKKAGSATKTASQLRGSAAKENRDRDGSPDARAANVQRDAEAWARLLETLGNLRHLIEPTQSCHDFVEWAPKVARYSFQSGRVLLTRGANPRT